MACPLGTTMDSQIADLLKENDTVRRREGVIRAARSGDPGYVQVLKERYPSETDPELQILIKKAVIYLQNGSARSARFAIPNHVLLPAPIPHLPAQKTTASRSNPDDKRVGRLLLFLIYTLVVIGIGALVIWEADGSAIQRSLWQRQFNEKLASATALPGTPLAANQRLTGSVFNTRVSALTSYVVVEPEADPGPTGWPVLLVLHGWMGNGLSEIPNYAAQAAHDGVILVAPTFDHASNPTYEAVYHDIRTILGQLKAHYRVDWQASVIAGFSWGGRVAQFYSVAYIKDFGGAVVGGSREYMTVPDDSLVRYVVFVGTADFYDNVNRSQLAKEFVASMAKRGKPVWYFENTPGVGHQMVQEQVNKTFELIAALRSHR
jgi:dienelactone hydrolase